MASPAKKVKKEISNVSVPNESALTSVAQSVSSKDLSADTLRREWTDIETRGLNGFTVKPQLDNMYVWDVTMLGPPCGLFEGAVFVGKLEFSYNYPAEAPIFTLKSKIWHPNFFDDGKLDPSAIKYMVGEGNIGKQTTRKTEGGSQSQADQPLVTDGNKKVSQKNVEKSQEDTTPTYNIRKVLAAVLCLLDNPSLENPATFEAAREYKEWKNKTNPLYAEHNKKYANISKTEAQNSKLKIPPSYKKKVMELIRNDQEKNNIQAKRKKEKVVNRYQSCKNNCNNKNVLYRER